MSKTWVFSMEFEGYTTGDVWVDLGDEEFETEDEDDARTQVEDTLMNIAYDWGNVVVE